ncbi:lysoplasmalogenase family protein [Mongoliibacter ruber]|uniref:YhhN-like protein n=1 Tax=Mongoliibacter ruber TaxID=1750599 RepID=A0A2T0WP68_9BACT|nr:lysoplasmalogenase family protein [Mongoliibacter ruber]PRY88475.1 YhhN-like protein [Mongoliibacter ruber]
MLSLKENTVKSYFLFVLISIILLLLGQYQIFLVSKLFILPSMMVLIFRYYQKSSHKLVPILLVSTFFSFLGDVLIVIQDEDFFKMLSLSSFLVAQAGYAYMFYTSFQYNKKRISIPLAKRWPEFLSVLVIGFLIFLVAPEMEEFFLLGVIYGIIACISMVLALDRRFYVSRKSYYTVFCGLVLFYISDILAGLDLELTNTLIHVLIILSFASGHYLIISGISQQIKEDTKKEASDLDAFIN